MKKRSKEFLEKLDKVRPILQLFYPKEKKEVDGIEIFIECLGNSYHYYMTNSLELLAKKIVEYNYDVPDLGDFRANPFLATEVQVKMNSLGMCFSMEMETAGVVNFCIPGNIPLIYYLGR